MKIIKPEGTEAPPQKTFDEVFEMIEGHLKEIENRVSTHREHSVESHLRSCVRLLGFRVRETASKRADIPALAAQCRQALKILNGDAPEKSHEFLELHVTAILSNVAAEARERVSEIPAERELPEPPQT